MKTKTTQLYDQKTQEFIKQHNADTLNLVEVICLTIVAVVALNCIRHVLGILFSRSVYIDTRDVKKVIVSKQHMLPRQRD